ncbi:B12-binding domain-containing radical SAM protein [Desulfomarina sp.]
MLILHPPGAKPCEPPASLPYLAAALRQQNVSCHIIDMNIEGLFFLLKNPSPAHDTWSRRALKNREKNLRDICSPALYANRDRYARTVYDINRLLENEGKRFGLKLSLANYVDQELSPIKSNDLRQAAHNYSRNIYFPYFSMRLNELIDQHYPETVGISLNYLSQALCSFAIIGYLREKHPETKVILGGGLVTTWLSNPKWKNPFGTLIDALIPGKGEAPLLRLLNKSPANDHVRPVFNDLAKQGYLSPGFILPYTTSRGCFWKKCTFCPETSENNPYSHVPPDTTVNDLKHLVEETSPALIHFLDNALSSSTLKALAENPPNAPWYGFARFDTLLSEKEFCFKLRESGCVMLKLGLESGNQLVLDKMDKGINLKLAAKILENLENAGISTYIYLLFGTPAEDESSAEDTLAFVRTHVECISFLNLAIFNLPVCSMETVHLELSDFYEGDLSLYRNFTHPQQWNRRAVRHFIETRFKRSRDIAEILKNDPPFFTSNHAPFFKNFLNL